MLRHLRRLQLAGKVRTSAEALVLFDHSWPPDMSSWTRIGGLATWVRTVEFDEYAECLSMLQGQPDQVWCTRGRARGRFTVAAIPITSVQVDLVGERS